MATNLYSASEQWSKRPADERFWNLTEMAAKCREYRNNAATATVNMRELTAASVAGNLTIAGPEGKPAILTNWAFTQMAQRISAPAGYLQTLPAHIAASCVNTGLRRMGSEGDGANVLFHSNGSLVARSFNSDDYARIWNCDLVDRLIQLVDSGWRVPPARPVAAGANTRIATEADVLKFSSHPQLGVKVGDVIGPAGLYASDHDAFVYLINEENRIEDGSDGGLSRGCFISNSEVGAGAFKIFTFLYKHTCGNHIVVGVKDMAELRIVHRGRNNEQYGYKMKVALREYANAGSSEETLMVKRAITQEIGGTKDEVLDKLFGMKILTRKKLEAAYDACVQQEDRLSPRSAYGMAQGITYLSQQTPYMDERVEMDRAAGKVMAISF